MSCGKTVSILPGTYTVGDLENPINVKWNQVLTTETSELIIDRPTGGSVTLAGSLTDASVGQYEYPWTAGALVEGKGQLCKARLFLSGSRRRSTPYFRIDVDADVT